MAKAVLVTMPAKLEAEKIASWLSKLVHSVEVGPAQGQWGIYVPQAALHRAQTALRKVIAAANNNGRGRMIVAARIKPVRGVRFNAAKGIPKGQIEWLVDRLHAGTSDAEVEREIRGRVSGPGWTPAKIRQACAHAVAHHRRNRGIMARVLRGIPNPARPAGDWYIRELGYDERGRVCEFLKKGPFPTKAAGLAWATRHATYPFIVKRGRAGVRKNGPPVNKRARREQRRQERRLKESLGLSGRPLAKRAAWTGGHDAFNQGRRAGSGYVRFWLWNDKEWKLNLRSSYDGVGGEPTLRESAKNYADEQANKTRVASRFPGQTGKWKAGFILAFEKEIAAAFGPRREWSDADEDYKSPDLMRARAARRLRLKKDRARRVAAVRAARGASTNPSSERRLAKERKTLMMLARLRSIIQAGGHKLDRGDLKEAVESYKRADALYGQLPKGVLLSPATRRVGFEMNRALVHLQNRIVFAMDRPPRGGKARRGYNKNRRGR